MRSLSVALAFLPSILLADSGLSIADSVRYAKLKEQVGANVATSLGTLEEAVRLYQRDGDMWLRLAQARLQAKKYDESIEAYQKALELGAFANKFKASCEYDIACAFALKGQREKSFEWLGKSMASGFRDLQLVRSDKDLDTLHTDRRWEALAATKDVTKMKRDDGWRYDLWLLDREVRRIHFNPYRLHSKEDHEKWVRNLDRAIPKMTDNQIRVAFMKYMQRMGDGHTGIRPPREKVMSVPVQLYWFEEGVFVNAASPELADIVGAQVLEVEGKPVEEISNLVREIAWRDNDTAIPSVTPRYLTIPGILHGLGAMADKDDLVYTIRDSKGAVRKVTLGTKQNPEANDTWVTSRPTTGDQPLYLKNRAKPYWFEYLPESKTLYFQYNAVRNDTAESSAKFAERMFDFIDKNDVERLVVDARWNGGGNSFLNRPLVNGIIGSKKVNQPGKLFVIIGRQTFSAAQNFVTDIERQCDAIFVGEPSGSSPNFVGESVGFTLPYSKMTGSISDLYWQRSWPMDHRNWIAPDLPAAPSFELYKANRDPAMEAISAYVKG